MSGCRQFIWRVLSAASMVVGLLVAGTAQSADVEAAGYTIYAIYNLTIGKQTYDVLFSNTTAQAIYGHAAGPSFDFETRQDAKAAMEAVLAVINAHHDCLEGDVGARCINGAGPENTPTFRIGWASEEREIDPPGMDAYKVSYVNVWEGVCDDNGDGGWSIPTGENGAEVPNTFLYWDNGTFARLVATAYGGTGNSPPAADAGGPYDGAVGQSVKFDGSGSRDQDDGIKSYIWDFGDGSDPVWRKKSEHVYATKGIYNVTLTVKDNSGARSSDNTTATIGARSKPPVADAGGPYEGSVGALLKFDGSGSTDPDGGIRTYKWDFGDGSEPVRGKKPEHAYAASGEYMVVLTVKDKSGERDDDTARATIGEGNRAPIADAGPSYSGTIGEPVAFDSHGSSDSDGEIDKYRWSFGDGSKFIRGRRPEHTYGAAGTYTATLEVTDDDGAKDTDSSTVIIKE